MTRWWLPAVLWLVLAAPMAVLAEDAAIDGEAGVDAASDADADAGGDEIELTSPDETEEMTIESEDKPAPPAPTPAPAPAPAPKPRPKPRPKAPPKPAVPPSPWQMLVLEPFDKIEPGKETGTIQRSAGVQFTARVSGPGHDGPQALFIQGIPSLAEKSTWTWTPADGKPVDLSAWRGISLWVKASATVGEIRLGVAGGGSVFTSATVGIEWTEVKLDFTRDSGRGRFDPSRVTAIVLSFAHEQMTPLDVTVDTIAAWRERVPSDALRLGLNVPPLPGPGDWSPDFRAVNCAGRSTAAEGFVLSFWTGELPYAHRRIIATWNALPRGLAGASAIVAQARLDPAQPQVVVKLTLVEEAGEQFSALRVLPAEGPVSIALDEFVWDTIENARIPPVQVGNGLLDPGAVTGWRFEVIPATERPCKGTIVIRELWAEGSTKPGKLGRARPGAKPAAAAAATAVEPAAPAAADAAASPTDTAGSEDEILDDASGGAPAGDGAVDEAVDEGAATTDESGGADAATDSSETEDGAVDGTATPSTATPDSAATPAPATAPAPAAAPAPAEAAPEDSGL